MLGGLEIRCTGVFAGGVGNRAQCRHGDGKDVHAHALAAGGGFAAVAVVRPAGCRRFMRRVAVVMTGLLVVAWWLLRHRGDANRRQALPILGVLMRHRLGKLADEQARAK